MSGEIEKYAKTDSNFEVPTRIEAAVLFVINPLI